MHFKQNNKESKTYVQGLRSFGNTLPTGLKGILKKNGYNYSEIISKWNILVGKEISSLAYPKSIKMKKGDKHGLLVLSIQRGDEINVEYSKKKIIDKINSYFGYKLINEIKLQAFNTEIKKPKNSNNLKIIPKNLQEKINQVKNNKIKNALTELLNTVKNDKT